MSEKNSNTVMVRPFISQSKESRRSYRTFDDIKAEILSFARKDALFSQIMCRCGMSFQQCHKYLRTLNDTGFLNVQEAEGRKVYTITEKGKRWLQAYRQLREIK